MACGYLISVSQCSVKTPVYPVVKTAKQGDALL